MQVTQHFRADEFDSHDGAIYPPEWVAERLKPLCDTLEAVRAELGGAPCVIVSGYRSPSHNAALAARSSNVAKASQHVQGRAADVVFSGHPPARVHEVVLRMERAGRLPHLGGCGVYPGWVHLDVRPRKPDGTIARWTGEGFGSEPIA